MKRSLAYPLAAAVFLFAFVNDRARGQTFADWEFRCPITFSGYDKPGTLTNFPALVKLDPGAITGFDYAQFLAANGGDLRFAASNETTELNYEIESWNTAGVSYVWVQVDILEDAASLIYAYWGMETNAPAYATNGAAWDANYKGVWHMTESDAEDSTTNGHNGTAYGSVTPVTNGPTGSANDFDRDADYVQVPDSDDFTLAAAYTVSAWINSAPVANVWEAFVGTYNGQGFIFSLQNNAANTLSFWTGSTSWRYSGYGVSDAQWKHVVYTRNGTRGRFYVDGVLVLEIANAGAGSNGGVLHLGAGGTSWGSNRFDGKVDEVRISQAERGSNWVWAAWLNAASNATFLTYGIADTQASSLAVKALPVSDLTTSSVTLNGKVVHAGDAENPYTYFCRDFSDQGTNSGTNAWANVLLMGTNWGKRQTFSTNLTGLMSATNYTVRCYVTNSTGSAWSEEAISFKPVYLPAITNTGASNALWTTAELTGEVLDNGSENPACWLHYWMSGSASTSVIAVGTQGGAFSQEVGPLYPSSTYEYKILASNQAGAVWSEVKSFQTQRPHYVATNGLSISPYTNWVNAATNIADALALATLDGDSVLVSNGTYAIATTFALTNGITVWGVNGSSNTTISCKLPTGGYIPAVYVAHAGAAFRGFKITDAIDQFYYNYFGPLKLEAGLVEDCLITGNRNRSVGGAYVSGGVMRNCTISGNSATHQNTGYGGGLRVTGGVVSNCVISSNYANDGGGGVYMTGGKMTACTIDRNWRNGAATSRYGGGVWMTAGTLENCLVYSNRIYGTTGYAAGVYAAGGEVVNCTIVNNVRIENDTYSGLYLNGGSAVNCVCYYNGLTFPASGQENFYNAAVGTLTYSCTQPLVSDTGNISDNPSFVARGSNDYHLAFGSGCIDVATNVTGVGVDRDGETRPKDGDGNGTPAYDMGCYEAADASGIFGCSFAGTPLIGTNSLEVVFTASVVGPGTGTVTYVWDFENDGNVDLSGTRYAQVTNTYGSPGFYTVKLICTNALSDTSEKVRSEYVQVWSMDAYVALGAGSVAPYDTWAKATPNPQDAVNAVADGGTVHVSNGVYAVASKINIVRAVTLTGVNGASNTVFDSAGPNHLLDILHAGAVVEHLSFTGVGPLGYPNSGAIDLTAGVLRYCHVTNNILGTYGGGIHMEGGLVHGCLIAGNAANHQNTGMGGGVGIYDGVVSNCTIIGNRAWDHGGGVYMTGGKVTQCVISNNVQYGNVGVRGGGGVYLTGGTLENCLVAGNSLSGALALQGGGIEMIGGSIVHCTVADNTRVGGDPYSGLYMTAGTVTNSIFYYNSPSFPVAGNENVYQSGGTIVSSCMQPIIAGAGNIDSDPGFAGRAALDYRLGSGSPCLDSGTNLPSVTLDLDGEPRPTDGDGNGVDGYDIGCYEREVGGAVFEVSFSATPLHGTNSLQAVFTAAPLGPGTNSVTYTWDWTDDGTNDWVTASAVATNTYTEPGSYSARLTAVNAVGQTATVTRVAYLRVWALEAYASHVGANEFPYHTWAKATPSVESAFNSVAPGGTVYVTNGSYDISARINVQKVVTITGVNGPSNTTLRSASGAQIFSIEDADAVVDGLLLRGARLSYFNYGVAQMTAGILRNCIITDNTIGSCGGLRVDGGLAYNCIITNNYASHQNTGFGGGAQVTGGVVSNCVIMANRANDAGGGVSLTGGTVVNCVISGNSKTGPNTGLTRAGAGVRMTGGLLNNCVIQSNIMAQAATPAGGLYVGGGTARGCLVTHNSATLEGGGVYVGNGLVESCTIATNTSVSGAGGLHMTAGLASNCVIALNVSGVPALADLGGPVTNLHYSISPTLSSGVDGNLGQTPTFLNAQAGSFQFAKGSLGIDAGADQAWMVGALDLAGEKRRFAPRVDMGAYEYQPPPGTMILIR